MRTRELGQGGPQVSVVCFGAWPIGGGLGAVEENQAISTVHAALDVGMTFIDTAEGYQTSEGVLGRALRRRRHEAVIATKVSGNDHSPEHIRNALESSLRTLGTDYVDLYQLHSPQPQWPIEQTMETLVGLKNEGKIRFIGVSNYSPEQTLEAMKFGPVHSSQPRYNLIFRAERKVLDFCEVNGIGVIPHSVLAKGLLTGKYAPGHQFAADDERRLFNFFKGELFEQGLGVTQKLAEWSRDKGRDLVQLAVAWAIAQPGVSSAIVGAKSPEQARHNAAGADWELTASDLDAIDDIIGAFQPEWQKAAMG